MTIQIQYQTTFAVICPCILWCVSHGHCAVQLLCERSRFVTLKIVLSNSTRICNAIAATEKKFFLQPQLHCILCREDGTHGRAHRSSARSWSRQHYTLRATLVRTCVAETCLCVVSLRCATRTPDNLLSSVVWTVGIMRDLSEQIAFGCATPSRCTRPPGSHRRQVHRCILPQPPSKNINICPVAHDL